MEVFEVCSPVICCPSTEFSICRLEADIWFTVSVSVGADFLHVGVAGSKHNPTLEAGRLVVFC